MVARVPGPSARRSAGFALDRYRPRQQRTARSSCTVLAAWQHGCSGRDSRAGLRSNDRVLPAPQRWRRAPRAAEVQGRPPNDCPAGARRGGTSGTTPAASRRPARGRTLWHDLGFVIANHTGGPVDRRTDTDDWLDLIRQAGVRRLRLHDCRHSAATALLVLGADARVLDGNDGLDIDGARPAIHTHGSGAPARCRGTPSNALAPFDRNVTARLLGLTAFWPSLTAGRARALIANVAVPSRSRGGLYRSTQHFLKSQRGSGVWWRGSRSG